MPASAMLMTVPHPVALADTTASFHVAAKIQAGCLVQGAGAGPSFGRLDFGQASAASTETRMASLAANQSIALRCTPQTALFMAIDGGAHAAGGARHLQRQGDAASRITYSLCADAACAQPIPVATPLGIAVTTANADHVALPIYGRLTLPGNLPSGTYDDTLTVTLTW